MLRILNNRAWNIKKTTTNAQIRRNNALAVQMVTNLEAVYRFNGHIIDPIHLHHNVTKEKPTTLFSDRDSKI